MVTCIREMMIRTPAFALGHRQGEGRTELGIGILCVGRRWGGDGLNR